jgi:hypothetical protein
LVGLPLNKGKLALDLVFKMMKYVENCTVKPVSDTKFAAAKPPQNFLPIFKALDLVFSST